VVLISSDSGLEAFAFGYRRRYTDVKVADFLVSLTGKYKSLFVGMRDMI
jgi:hypothetical protein